VANEPFTKWAIKAKSRKVYTLSGDLVSELRGLQGEWLKLKGKSLKVNLFCFLLKGFLVLSINVQP